MTPEERARQVVARSGEADFEEEIASAIREAVAEAVGAPGRARAEKLSPERRAEIARQAAAARWGKGK